MSCKHNNSMYTTVPPVMEEDTIFEGDDFNMDNDPYYEIIEEYRKMAAWGEY